MKINEMEIRQTKHAGLGVFATKIYDPGDLIWEETPAVATQDQLSFAELECCQGKSKIFRNQVIYMRTFVQSSEAVKEVLRKRYVPSRDICEKSYLWKFIQAAGKEASESLYPQYSPKELEDICLVFMCNQYPSNNDAGLIFKYGSIFNHHCSPNATYVFDNSRKKGSWIALRPIFPGEEICVSYILSHYPTFWRKDQLMHRYLFKCECSKCADVDHNRLIPCTSCHPRDGSLLSSLSPSSFFIKTAENSGSFDCWVCQSCGTERASCGVPLLIEKQLCVDVQMMMNKWRQCSLDEVSELRHLALRMLGPKHFCAVYALHCKANAMVRAETTDFKSLIKSAMEIVEWIEDKEPGLSGFHLKGFLFNIVSWCVKNDAELEACLTLAELAKPWVHIFGSKDEIDEWYILWEKLRHVQLICC